jgi:hypothetical protein
MNTFSNIVIGLVFVSLIVVGYWAMNPSKIPTFLRWEGRGLEVPTPNGPTRNFRPPQFGNL